MIFGLSEYLGKHPNNYRNNSRRVWGCRRSFLRRWLPSGCKSRSFKRKKQYAASEYLGKHPNNYRNNSRRVWGCRRSFLRRWLPSGCKSRSFKRKKQYAASFQCQRGQQFVPRCYFHCSTQVSPWSMDIKSVLASSLSGQTVEQYPNSHKQTCSGQRWELDRTNCNRRS